MSKEINSPEAFLYSASASSNAPFLAWFPSIMTYDDGRDYVTTKGEYMLDYSWAEPTAGLLFFGKNKK